MTAASHHPGRVKLLMSVPNEVQQPPALAGGTTDSLVAYGLPPG